MRINLRTNLRTDLLRRARRTGGFWRTFFYHLRRVPPSPRLPLIVIWIAIAVIAGSNFFAFPGRLAIALLGLVIQAIGVLWLLAILSRLR